MKKKITTLLLCLVLCLAMALPASADASLTASATSGDSSIKVSGSELPAGNYMGVVWQYKNAADETFDQAKADVRAYFNCVIGADGTLAQTEVDAGYTLQSGDKLRVVLTEGVYADMVVSAAGNGGSSTRRSSGGGGGGGGVTNYSVSVGATSNGIVSVSHTTASSGTTITVTVKPDSGYELDQLTVKRPTGADVAVTKSNDTTYTFTMPSGTVNVAATFKKAAAQVAADPVNPFNDVASSSFAYDAILWAAANHITTGTSANTFSPKNSCTRAEAVTFLWRVKGSPEPAGTADRFTDVAGDANNSWYVKAVAWAVENNITLGTNTAGTKFSPYATVDRSQFVTFLYRAEKGTPSGSNRFTDVAGDAYYADAVNWAVSHQITTGTNDGTTFSPADPCNREQTVTFLYRQYAKK